MEIIILKRKTLTKRGNFHGNLYTDVEIKNKQG